MWAIHVISDIFKSFKIPCQQMFMYPYIYDLWNIQIPQYSGHYSLPFLCVGFLCVTEYFLRDKLLDIWEFERFMRLK